MTRNLSKTMEHHRHPPVRLQKFHGVLNPGGFRKMSFSIPVKLLSLKVLRPSEFHSLGRQRREDLCEVKVSLFYRASSRPGK